MLECRVIGLCGGNYKVLTTKNEELVCRASGRLRNVKVDKKSTFNQSTNKNSTKLDTKFIKLSPKVGDFVIVDSSEDTNYILDVLPRKNEMVRPDIANVDQILLIFAAKKPDFSFLLLDLFLINLAKQKIEPILIISKIDLLSENELNTLKESLSYYESIGYKVIYVNSMAKTNIEEIIPLLADKISVLSGQTGAGKSTLINALIPGFTLQTQEISNALGRGKHTTRETTLYQYYGGLIGDTPGFSKLDLSQMTPLELPNYFIEFAKYPCRFSGCHHGEKSKDCGIIEAVNKGKILKSRYDNYLKIYDDMQSLKNRG